nr:S8 family serine peptidase [Wenzhouxiangella sp. XN79A]
MIAAAALLAPMASFANNELSPADEQGRYRYLVTLGDDGLLQRGLLPRKGQAAATRSAEFLSAQSELATQQADALDRISLAVGRQVEASHHFLVMSNAIGVRLTQAEAERVRSLPDVRSVERERLYELDTYRGPGFIGAASLWDGTAAPQPGQYRGEGMVAGVIDSGVNLDHPMYADDPSCGFGVGGTPSKLLAALDCSSTDDGTIGGRCNGPDPEGASGSHGSHTASTVAGNLIDETADPAPTIPEPFDQMSGVAPCAHIRTYNTCPDSCPGFDIQAAMSTILLDGDVDVMNFSISGGNNPWVDNDRRKLDLVDAGIFVAASAGNTRAGTPDPVGEVNHYGPWVMSVAASTRDGDFEGVMSVTGPGSPPPATQAVDMLPGSNSPIGSQLIDHPIRRDTAQPAGIEGCENADPPVAGAVAFPASFFDGAVALIQRGGCAFTTKINNAAAAGADMVIIWNNTTGTISMSTPGQDAVPAYSIQQAPGQAIADFVDLNPTTATMDFDLIASPGDVLADFSLRGPSQAPLQNLQKPNITAPGVGIYAAVADPTQYGVLSGTSMSSPHVAGAALLVRQAQPDWGPMEVKSALQMTATGDSGTKEDGVTPWDWDDVGSGRVDLTAAALAGLVMDEIFDNFLAANPAAGGDVRMLNLPSVRDMDCSPECTFTRTVRAGRDFPTAWTVTTDGAGMDILVTPSSFSLDARSDFIFADGLEIDPIEVPVDTQELTITISNVSPGAIRFGEILLTEDGGLTPPARITAAASD